MAKDPNAAAQRWAQNLGAATSKIAEGVDAVSVAPGTMAARQRQVWAQNTMAAQDKWARNTAAVTLGEWQTAMKEKGVQRIASGASAAVPRMAAFLTAFLPHVETGVRQLPARGNLDQNISRMVAMVRHNAQFGQRGAAR